ncbi:MAG TPA: tetratricopeptide repeat protein, partial [Chloroflexota bacterium]
MQEALTAPTLVDGLESRLPPAVTPLVGRTVEVMTIQRLLHDGVRLLTLVGPAGVGKTRLAAHVAGLVAAAFDRVDWIDLTAVSEAAAFLPYLAQELDTRDHAGQPPLLSIAATLRGQRCLLVLDNFEQVTVAAGEVGRLLAANAQLTILVTSRAALRLQWEQLLPVAPLALPTSNAPAPADAPAVALFVQRVQALQPDFHLTPENAAAVTEIVSLLDGIPLFIEFAAAHCTVFSPQALLPLLQEPLDFLTSRWLDVSPRQQSPRQALDWSYQLLSRCERTLLGRLSVFVDGATLASIQTVCREGSETEPPTTDAMREILVTLASLVDQSLLQRREDERGEPRFRLLQITRAYVLDHWQEGDDSNALRRRHALHFLTMAEQANVEFDRKTASSWVNRPDRNAASQHMHWMQRIDLEMGNMRAAHVYFLTDATCVEQRLRLAASLDFYWTHRGELAEGRSWLDAALSACSENAVADQYRAHALYVAGKLAENQGDYAAARTFLTQGISLLRATGDRLRLADALAWSACVATAVSPEAELQALLEESLAIYRQLGAVPGMAKALNFLGEQARLRGDYDQASAFYNQSLALYEESHEQKAQAVLRHNLGYIAQHQRDYAGATALFSDALALYREYEDRRLLVICLAALAAVATIGRPERAARLFAAAEAHLEAMDTRMQPPDLAQHQRNVADVRAALGEQAFQQAWEEGRTMSLEQALAYVQEMAPAASTAEPLRPGRPAPRPEEPLTAREREVAAHIAQGFTNRQIAHRLVIAERTV